MQTTRDRESAQSAKDRDKHVPGTRVSTPPQVELRNESQPGFLGIAFSPEKFGIETNLEFVAKDLAWRLIRKESRDSRIEEFEPKSDFDGAPRPKNTKP